MNFELQTLDMLAQNLRAARDFLDLAHTLAKHLPPLCPFDSLALAFAQSEGTALRVGPSLRGSPPALATGELLDLGTPEFQSLFRAEKGPVLIPLDIPADAPAFCEAFQAAHARGYYTALAAPLFDRSQSPAGGLLLFAADPGTYDGITYHAVNIVASMIEAFLENARRDGRLAASSAMRERLVERADRLAALATASTEHATREDLLGESPAWKGLCAQVETIAPLDVTVLIQGETGTGKEVVARALHHRSPRAHRPFVAVNCGAIPPTLASSELFGHEKGAFTGADRRRIGYFEAAGGGTLFLDEVGELPPELQAQLLRVLQDRRITRVGGHQSLRVDVRILAATHRDLIEDCKTGRFREDLYYRLNVLPLRVPPLRERMADLPLLLDHFLEKFARKLGRHFDGIAPGVVERCAAYRWPGNIRELENLVERHAVLSEGTVFTMDPQPGTGAFSSKTIDSQHLDDAIREHLKAVLKSTGGRIYGTAGAAEALGMKPTTLQSKLKRLGIKRIGGEPT